MTDRGGSTRGGQNGFKENQSMEEGSGPGYIVYTAML